MDTGTAAGSTEQQIALIKARMPETYASIQAQAQRIGKAAYALVRRGLRGEPNCWWAMERGLVMGTPFTLPDVSADVASTMVRWGASYVCIWAQEPAA